MQSLSKEHRVEIIKNLLLEVNHREIVQKHIEMVFLNRVVDFFSKIVSAKLNSDSITNDWYKQIMLSKDLDKEDIAWNSGLNLKSINNVYHSTTKSIVLDASIKHYDELLEHVNRLIREDSIDVSITITLNKVSVTLSIDESLIVINAIAVMRAGLRGGIWSTMGKQIEKPFMNTLCRLLKVDSKYYAEQTIKSNNPRESDFFPTKDDGKHIRCEVKLMGKGNPESADGAMARDTQLFIADKLSDQNKSELDKRNIKWIAMADGQILDQFSKHLDHFEIPHTSINSALDVNTILNAIED